MPRTCTICKHADREAINAALIEGQAYRNVSVRFGTSVASLQRHKAEHMPVALAKAREVREANDISFADDLFAQLKALRNKAVKILNTAEAAGDLRTALLALREARATIELLLEVEGEINRNPQINILISPEWIELRTVILRTLAPFPEARFALADALAEGAA